MAAAALLRFSDRCRAAEGTFLPAGCCAWCLWGTDVGAAVSTAADVCACASRPGDGATWPCKGLGSIGGALLCTPVDCREMLPPISAAEGDGGVPLSGGPGAYTEATAAVGIGATGAERLAPMAVVSALCG